MKRILVTGGAGFIGSNFIRYLLNAYPDIHIINLDALTYAGNRENLSDLEGDPRYLFYQGDVQDRAVVDNLMSNVEAVVNFAAETHVDRSIHEAGEFLKTDVMGTFTLLESAKKHQIKRFLYISTDEVYGSIEVGSFKEIDPISPSSPYSASKAGGDLLAHSYFVTYGLPVLITRSSNNFGPYQYPEKLIPLFVTNAIDDKPLPLYGDGKNVRDWLYVVDNCAAIDLVLRKGNPGEVYNIGGDCERMNVEITHLILDIMGKPESLIKPVKDRPGHDRRYSVDTTKIRKLGWSPHPDFPKLLETTVKWYIDNQSWWRKIKEKQAEYKRFYDAHYGTGGIAEAVK
jgi:dTDP-glucose 4,6-dehydratase